jgi:hypothetical protein
MPVAKIHVHEGAFKGSPNDHSEEKSRPILGKNCCQHYGGDRADGCPH